MNEDIEQLRERAQVAKAKWDELEQIKAGLPAEIARASQEYHSLRYKLARLQAPLHGKKGRADELAYLERQLAELKGA